MQLSALQSRLTAAIGAILVAAVAVLAASCGSEESSLAERKAAVAARDAGAAQASPAVRVVSDGKRPVLPPQRDLGAILDRGVFRPLVVAEAPQSASARFELPQPPSGAPLVFTDVPEMAPDADGRPTAPPTGRDGDSGGSARGSSVLGEPSACQLAITGVVRDPDGYRLLVRFMPSGSTRWVVVGEEVFGYKVEAVTLQGAVVSKDGRYYILPLGKGVDGATPTNGTSQHGPAADGAEERPQEPEDTAAEARFHGTWSGSMMNGQVTMKITFNADHSGSAEIMGQSDTFTWSVSGSTVNTSGGRGGPQSLTFRFENDGKTLVLSGGQMPFDIRLEKQ